MSVTETVTLTRESVEDRLAPKLPALPTPIKGRALLRSRSFNMLKQFPAYLCSRGSSQDILDWLYNSRTKLSTYFGLLQKENVVFLFMMSYIPEDASHSESGTSDSSSTLTRSPAEDQNLYILSAQSLLIKGSKVLLVLSVWCCILILGLQMSWCLSVMTSSALTLPPGLIFLFTCIVVICSMGARLAFSPPKRPNIWYRRH